MEGVSRGARQKSTDDAVFLLPLHWFYTGVGALNCGIFMLSLSSGRCSLRFTALWPGSSCCQEMCKSVFQFETQGAVSSPPGVVAVPVRTVETKLPQHETGSGRVYTVSRMCIDDDLSLARRRAVAQLAGLRHEVAQTRARFSDPRGGWRVP